MLTLLYKYLAIVAVAVLFLFSSQSVSAQTYPNPYAVPSTNTNVPKNLHTLTQSVFLEFMSTISCQLGGYDPLTTDHRCLGIDNTTGKIGYIDTNGHGILGALSSMIAGLYIPPIRSSDYTHYLARNFGLVKSADAAQLTGYQSLQPLTSLWVGMRNLAYVFLIIIFMIVGFAIMFRVKIDPRTVMTLENQLPKIIITLILITFSFAIAGLMIDLMNVFIYLVFYFFVTNSPPNALGSLTPNLLQGTSAWGIANYLSPKGGGLFGYISTIAAGSTVLFQNIFGIQAHGMNLFDNFNWNDLANFGALFSNFGSLGDGTFSVVDWLLNVSGSIISGVIAGKFAGLTAGGAPAVGIGVWLGSYAALNVVMIPLIKTIVPYLILYIILLMAIVLALFRVWFSLLLSYAFIILDIVIAPLWILLGLFPGSEVKFESWLRDLAANLLVFPFTIGLFLFAIIASQMGTDGKMFLPPLIGNPGEGIIGPMLSISILLLTPQVGKMVKDALKVKENKYGTQLGATFGAGAGTVFQAGKAAAASQFGTAAPGETGWRAILGSVGLR
jgi:hypothetical protein